MLFGAFVDSAQEFIYRWEGFQNNVWIFAWIRHKRALIMRNSLKYFGWVVCLWVYASPVSAQYFPNNYYYDDQNPYWAGQEAQASQAYGRSAAPDASHPYGQAQHPGRLQYDQRDAERILRDQMSRARRRGQAADQPYPHQQYQQSPYGHRIADEEQVQGVMSEARGIGSLIRNRNGKSFVVFDKRNFQFYLFDRNGALLRIGPVAIGKGRTEVGAFETPVGVFPIKSKVPVDDWIRPDWYFVEEGEPIPQRWEDRRVPGFFRYKMVFDGTRYIHYAEATGGPLTHGCLGLDWQDAEAVFHSLEVGSHCIIIDQEFLVRLARGEFPVKKPAVAKPAAPEGQTRTVASRDDAGPAGTTAQSRQEPPPREAQTFESLW
jgi:hypothetical protein